MFEISFLMAELIYTGIWLLIRMIIWVRQKGIDWKREALLLLLYIDLAVIIRFVFFPRELIGGRVQPLVFDPSAVFPLRINLRPITRLFSYAGIRDTLWNVAGNAVMFIPSGIVLPIVFEKLDKGWKVAAAGAFVSLCIEILQLPFASRASDIDDVIMNTLGVVIGYGVYKAVKQLRKKEV